MTMQETHIRTPGQPWPNLSALYAGIIVKPDGIAWALLFPTDVPALPHQVWGEYDNVIEGAYDQYDGYANTLAMAAAGNKLAQAVRELPGDCYLPSRMEALTMFLTLREQIGSSWVWTSTQCSSCDAWCQGVADDDGYQYITGKDTELPAVLVRRSSLRSFDALLKIATEAEVTQ